MVSDKVLSCGVIITNGNYILLGHSTGNDFWDIPKGVQEPNETYIETVCRETKEEFGIILNPDKLIYLGIYEYNKFKDLAMFRAYVDNRLDVNYMSCTSMFERSNGDVLPEIDGYSWFTIYEAIKLKTSKSMSNLLNKILGLPDENDFKEIC